MRRPGALPWGEAKSISVTSVSFTLVSAAALLLPLFLRCFCWCFQPVLLGMSGRYVSRLVWEDPTGLRRRQSMSWYSLDFSDWRRSCTWGFQAAGLLLLPPYTPDHQQFHLSRRETLNRSQKKTLYPHAPFTLSRTPYSPPRYTFPRTSNWISRPRNESAGPRRGIWNRTPRYIVSLPWNRPVDVMVPNDT